MINNPPFFRFGGYLLLYCFIFLNFAIPAQASTFIQGRVIDSGSKEPLSYASVSIPGTGIGVITNTFGEFRFHLPENITAENIQISYIGYKKKTIEISSIKEDNFYIFEMIPEISKLDEVSIMSKKLMHSSEMVERAIKNIPKNYPHRRFLLHAYYRDYIRDIKTMEYENLTEAAVLIEDRGFNTNDYLYSKIQLEQIRFHPGLNIDNKLNSAYSTGAKKIPYAPYKQENELTILRGQDPIRNKNRNTERFIEVFEIGFIHDYTFRYNACLETDGVKIYEIVFTANPKLESQEYVDFLVNGKMYIEDGSFAILKLIYTVNSVIPNYSGKFLDISLEYKKHLNKYYLSYLSVCNYFEYKGKSVDIGKVQREQYFQFRELFVNKIETKSFKHIGYDDAIRKNISLLGIPVTEQKRFWETYNYPELGKFLGLN